MSPRWMVAFAAWASVLTIGAASASVLGGLTPNSLAAWTQSSSSGAPTVLTCDNFSLSAATGSALAGRPVQLPSKCGSFTWTIQQGTWTISSGQVNPGGSGATATISAGQTDASAEATILSANGNSRVAGVAIDHTGSSLIYLVGALSGPGTAALLLVNGGTVTTLASATATINATTVVRITRNGTAVTVSVDGVLRVSYTLTPGEVTTLSGGTKVGLYFDSGNAIRFTNMVATTAASP